MEEFERMLDRARISVERFVRYRLPSQSDADDVLQEIYIRAYQKFSQLKNKDSFKPWILSIARNQCNDYFRTKAARMEISMEELSEKELSVGRRGISVVHTVRETLELLGNKDKQILYLYFWKEMPQAEIAKQVGIPIGTVKSRLHTAKQHFKTKYPYHTEYQKGETKMEKLPEYIPQYKIEALEDAPFSVRWEELQGWQIVPKVGEKLIRFAKQYMIILKEVYSCERVYLCTMCDGSNNHYHIQLIPRYSYERQGSTNFVKPRQEYVYEEE